MPSACRPLGYNAGVLKQLRAQFGQIDRAAWRRFVLGLFGLSLALFAALNATSLRQEGLMRLAWWMSVFALVLTGIVAVKIVPPMARRTIFSRWSLKVNYRLTREGIAYLVLVGVIVLAALNTGNNLLFMILASLLAGIILSGVISRLVLTGLELSFVLPEHIFASVPFVSRVSVKNCKRFLPSFSVKLSSRPENKKEKKKKAQAGGASKAQGNGPRRILDRTIYLPYVPRMARVGQELELSFPRRGRYTQDGFQVSTRFPFGFLEKSTRIPLAQEILVYPNVQPTEEFFDVLPLISGERESQQKGRGHDLYAIRDYTESDSARHVDWKASAKLDRLQVREFTREDERRVVLAFDNRLPQSGPPEIEVGEEKREKFEKAVSFCACLAWHFFECNAQMQAVMSDWTSEMGPAGEVVYPILEKLAVVEPAEEKGGEDFLTRLAGEADEFKIIFTAQPQGSVPTALWNSSYLIFLDSL